MSAEELVEELEGEEEPEAEGEEREPLYPFYRVSGDVLNGAKVQAGWMTETEDIEYLVMDMTDVGVTRVEQAFALAFGWYVDRLNEQTQRAVAAGEQLEAAEAVEEEAADE